MAKGTRFRRFFVCTLLALLMCFSSLPLTASASWQPHQDYVNTPAYTRYPRARVYFDGMLGDCAYLFDSYYIMPLDGLCHLAGIRTTHTVDGDLHIVSGDGFELRYVENSRYIRINGRYYYNEGDFQIVDNRICVNISILESVFNVHANIQNGSIYFDTRSLSVIENNPNYYTETFGEENVYWLTHVIDAEGYREGLEGRMGVGNVVLNRVRSSLYPSTIYDVVFDTVGGVQFTVTVEGGLEQEPAELSSVAACLCLEGYNNIDTALFFVCPYACDTSWFDSALNFSKSIGNLSFYCLRGG